MIEIKRPKFGHGVNPPVVYRIDFNTGHFYIGGTKSAKTRFTAWQSCLKRGRGPKLIADILPNVKSASLSVIEFSTVEAVDERETYFIGENINNPLCLNRSSNNTNGIRPLPQHLRRKNSDRGMTWGEYVLFYGKRVNQYDLDGNFIRQYESISAAARGALVSERDMHRHFKTKKVRGIGGFVFRRACDDQKFELDIKKEPPTNKHIVKTVVGSSKPIIDLNTGIFYYSVGELAAFSNYAANTLYNKLGGFCHNDTQYRYA